MTKLKPCPFCGSHEVAIVRDSSWTNQEPMYAVNCLECAGRVGWFLDELKAVEAWNRRYKATCQWVDHGCTECDYEDYSRFDVPDVCPGCGREVIDYG